ncbi:efflux RND transporter periplasmic adaptor subunit [Oryzibacter oryziterrae]|uniref:efflux RND transporter periplasmic adaptor subunit n=1 Tax=Oryzibacter oryziterrae TaxID=2766474 RepID=UPI001EFFDEC4|nr:efflux RND transporter periplasmic adaptor subunit [Oryzibacter oryziterrae]
MRGVSVLLLLSGVLGMLGCQAAEPQKPTVRTVLSMIVAPKAGVIGPFAGSIKPRYESTLAFRALGAVTIRAINLGDYVRKGQHLASLDPITFDLAINNARAAVADANAQYANVAAAEKRVQALFDEKHATSQQLEAIQQARVATNAGVRRAQSLLDKALEQRSYAELTAEFDGVVTAVNLEVGQVVTPGQPVVTIARPDIREAVIDVPDDVAGSLHEGSRFRIELQVVPGIQADGEVREIAPSVDPLTRSRRVKISLPTPPSEFRLGTTITASAATGLAGVIEIPASAVFTQDGHEAVWVVDPASTSVAARQIKTAHPGDAVVTVLSGLQPGERIVRAGAHALQPGQTVRLSEETQL